MQCSFLSEELPGRKGSHAGECTGAMRAGTGSARHTVRWVHNWRTGGGAEPRTRKAHPRACCPWWHKQGAEARWWGVGAGRWRRSQALASRYGVESKGPVGILRCPVRMDRPVWTGQCLCPCETRWDARATSEDLTQGRELAQESCSFLGRCPRVRVSAHGQEAVVGVFRATPITGTGVHAKCGTALQSVQQRLVHRASRNDVACKPRPEGGDGGKDRLCHRESLLQSSQGGAYQSLMTVT